MYDYRGIIHMAMGRDSGDTADGKTNIIADTPQVLF